MTRKRSRATTIRHSRAMLGWSLAAFALLAVVVIGAAELTRAPAAAAIGGPFELVDQDGRAVTNATYRGKFLLVYFGYTDCPDACPTALNDMAEALDGLGPLRARVQPLFITIDPARDTQAVLKSFTSSFDAGIVGLTGSAEQIAKVAKAFRVEYRREGPARGDYAMAHSSVIYLTGPDGRVITNFSDATSPGTIRARLREALS